MRHYFRIILILISASFLTASGLRAQSAGGIAGAENYIINGNNVAPGTYDWMVALVRSGSATPYAGQFCGGSLINPHWVLTAAHCVEDLNPADVEIWAGLTDLSNPGANAEMRTVRAIYIHPDYNSFGFESDIALLLLDSPIDTIAPITYSQNPAAIGPGTTARAIGWGLSQVSPPIEPNILQTTELDVVNNLVASQAYGVPLVGTQYLAASRDGFDTCFGDSGGPFFDPSNPGVGGPLLFGVTSFGLSCPAQAAFPSVFANVGTFAPWINLFLAQPTGPDPNLAVFNNGLALPNGAAPSKAYGTKFKKRIKPGKKKTKTLLITNAPGTIPLTVSSVLVSGRGFTLQSEEPDHVFQGIPETLTIRARAPKSKRSKKLRGTVLITSTDPAKPIYAFKLKAKSKKKKRRRRFSRF